MKLRKPARALLALAALVLATRVLLAHDLFLKLDSYFLPPHAPVRALLLNGTFTKSEGAVARDRVADLALVGPSGRIRLDTTALTASHDGGEVHLRTGAEGTYVLGLAVRPREISLTGDQFNGYLKEEGLDDMLAERTRTGTLTEAARERYAKHVKAIFQVGKTRSEAYATVLGYPAELVPLGNPYDLKPGGTLRVRCLVKGEPGAGLTVLAGGVTRSGAAIAELRSISDSAGVATFRLAQRGRWYVKFIRMQHATEPGVTHESLWATLSFEVK